MLTRKYWRLFFENEIVSEEISPEGVWRQYGFFDLRKSDYSMEKVKYLENTILHLNQIYLTVKKKIFDCDFFVLGQIIETANSPEGISTLVLKENEVKMIRPKYNAETREFLGSYETVGFMVVKGSPDEVFLNYGYDKGKPKVLYSHCRRRIPNTFSGSIFNRYRAIIETGQID